MAEHPPARLFLSLLSLRHRVAFHIAFSSRRNWPRGLNGQSCTQDAYAAKRIVPRAFKTFPYVTRSAGNGMLGCYPENIVVTIASTCYGKNFCVNIFNVDAHLRSHRWRSG